jgi:hypothetical protein
VTASLRFRRATCSYRDRRLRRRASVFGVGSGPARAIARSAARLPRARVAATRVNSSRQSPQRRRSSASSIDARTPSRHGFDRDSGIGRAAANLAADAQPAATTRAATVAAATFDSDLIVVPGAAVAGRFAVHGDTASRQRSMYASTSAGLKRTRRPTRTHGRSPRCRSRNSVVLDTFPSSARTASCERSDDRVAAYPGVS